MCYCSFGHSLANDTISKFPSDGCVYLLQQTLNPNNHSFESPVSVLLLPANQSRISQLAFLGLSTVLSPADLLYNSHQVWKSTKLFQFGNLERRIPSPSWSCPTSQKRSFTGSSYHTITNRDNKWRSLGKVNVMPQGVKTVNTILGQWQTTSPEDINGVSTLYG